MASHVVKLQAREDVARATIAVRLERPEGFSFKAGQAIDVRLPDGNTHAFSIVSAPAERDLLIATRMRPTPYKKALAALPIGAQVGIDGPFGALTLHKDASRAAVMVAGGIGITPFMSILRQAAHDGAQRDLVLVYANRVPEEAAFLEELRLLGEAHPRIRIVATMNGLQGSPTAGRGETRPVGGELLREAARGLAKPVFYVAGPPGMVQAAVAALEQAGIDDGDIRIEEFNGYPSATVEAA